MNNKNKNKYVLETQTTQTNKENDAGQGPIYEKQAWKAFANLQGH